MLTSHNLNEFFASLLINLPCRADTRAYITGLHTKFRTAQYDLSNDSITLQYAQARNKQDFLTFQNIADWVFFIDIWAPQHLRYASKDYYDTVARLSYYSCYRLSGHSWICYEELADNFLILEAHIKNLLVEAHIEELK